MGSLQVARDIRDACTYLEKYGWKLGPERYNANEKRVCILSALKLKSIDYDLEIPLSDLKKILAEDELLKSYQGICSIDIALRIMILIPQGTMSVNNLCSEENEWLKAAKIVEAIKKIDAIYKVDSALF